MRPLRAVWLGRVGYTEAVALQEGLRRQILDGDLGAEALLLLEHDPVVTLGRGGRAESLLVEPAALEKRGIALARSTRGGDVTYHGPGQLVAYPVVRLDKGVLAHVQAMAQAVIEVARGCGVRAEFRRDCPGVWTGPETKLAAFGVHVHRRVAIHGVALNVSTALEAFDLIVPCGLRGTRATSLSVEARRPLGVAELTEPFAAAFAAELGRPLELARPNDGGVRDWLLSRSPSVE
jgi:lipoate-protein ligase B